MKKKCIALLLILSLFIGMFPLNVLAEDKEYINSHEEEAANDGILGRLQGNTPDEFYDNSYYSRANVITHSDKFKGYKIEEGIDVSHHNGYINWNTVKKSGIDFAIIRVGARGYGTTGTLIDDTKFVDNIKGAKAAGLDVGVYFFSQAITVAEAVEEAEYVLEKIKGYDLELPVIFDFEYVSGGRLQRDAMTNRERTDLCFAFCKMIESAGYNAMVYANRYTLTNDLYASQLAENYDIWLAVYAKSANYNGEYSYWQYTESGSVPGVSSTYVDMNFHYYLPNLSISMRQKDSIYLNWTEAEGADGYNIYEKLEDGTYILLAKNKGVDHTSFKHEGLQQNSEHTYKITYYQTDENGQQVESETGYEEVTGRTLVEVGRVSLSVSALSAGSVKLSWDKVENADGYVVQQYNSTSGTYKTVKTIANGSTTSYTRTGLKIATNYKYRVKAYADVGEEKQYGQFSKICSIKTLSTLSKPIVESKANSYSKIQLTWKRIQGATGYQVQRYSTSKKKYVTIKTISGGTTLSYIDSSLSPRTSYKYRVRAYAVKSGEKVYSSWSAVGNVKTKARLSTPKLTVKTKSYTSLGLSWDKVKNAKGYEIQRYDNTSKKYVTIKTIKDGSISSYTNTYLNANTTYKYRIRAYTVVSGKKHYSYYSSAKSAKTGEARIGEVVCSKLTVRSGAGTTYKKLASLKKGEQVTITGSRSGWYRIRIKINGTNKTAYVSKNYVKLIKS